jgi:KDO2-lipid IV(A) lauroyltransferase
MNSIDSIDIINIMLLQAFRWLLFLLPRRLCLRLGEGAGALLFRLDGRHRRLALANLKKALGSDLSPAQRLLVARKSFLHFGRMLVDNLKWAYLGETKRQSLLRVEGEENIRQALKQGKGVLLFSAHFGNWEVASLALSRLGGLSVVARPLDSLSAERELVRFRASLGAKIIYKQQAVKPILRALRRNEMVAILIDQNVLRSQAVFVDFFGLPAATTPSLASFHLRTQAPLIPVFCYPASLFSYLVKIASPLDIEPSGEWEEDVLKITQRCTKIIETEIRVQPDLWFWFHNRWKTRPENETRGSGR